MISDLSQPFVVHALLAGGAVGLLCGLVGHFVVLRAQVFAGDALTHVAYAGTVAAVLAGVDGRVGLFAGSVLGGAALTMLGGDRRADDTAIGTAFAFVLGLGVLFLSLATTAGGTTNVNALFGSLFGVSTSAAVLAGVVAVVASGVLLAVARPLLMASVDPRVALARGVPAGLLGTGFLVLLGVTAAEASQVVGALLLLGLLAGPAATAARLTAQPWHALALSGLFGVLGVVLGVVLSVEVPEVPVSSAITGVVVAGYLLSLLLPRGRRRRA